MVFVWEAKEETTVFLYIYILFHVDALTVRCLLDELQGFQHLKTTRDLGKVDGSSPAPAQIYKKKITGENLFFSFE